MNCVGCASTRVTERREVTAQGYRRFRCRECGWQFNERNGDVLNRTCLPSDIIVFVVFCRLRYRLTLRDLNEIMALRGLEGSHEAVRDWEAKLLPVKGVELCKRRHGTRRGSRTARCYLPWQHLERRRGNEHRSENHRASR
jgi:putative transposase